MRCAWCHWAQPDVPTGRSGWLAHGHPVWSLSLASAPAVHLALGLTLTSGPRPLWPSCWPSPRVPAPWTVHIPLSVSHHVRATVSASHRVRVPPCPRPTVSVPPCPCCSGPSPADCPSRLALSQLLSVASTEVASRAAAVCLRRWQLGVFSACPGPLCIGPQWPALCHPSQGSSALGSPRQCHWGLSQLSPSWKKGRSFPGVEGPVRVVGGPGVNSRPDLPGTAGLLTGGDPGVPPRPHTLQTLPWAARRFPCGE